MTGFCGFRQRHRGIVPILILTTFLLGYVPSFVFKFVWLNLRSVEVSEDLGIEANRNIIMDFKGSYSVEIRRVSDHKLICSGEPTPRLINYQKRASLTNPYVSDLWDWAALDNPWKIGFCVNNGLVSDESFYLITCHFAYGIFNILLGKRCVKSNVFTPTDEAIPKLGEHYAL